MGEAKPPQYYENTLTPLPVDAGTLVESLKQLREAVHIGSELVHANEIVPEKWSVGGMFKFFPGTIECLLLY